MIFQHSRRAHPVRSVDSKNQQVAEVTLRARRWSLPGEEVSQALYTASDRVTAQTRRQVERQGTRVQKRRVEG